jgi:succinoglycan biosynthesis protein ExoA
MDRDEMIQAEKKQEALLVVIPCLNEELYLESVVRGILANNADLPLRIVIADGGSTDQTIAIAQQLASQYQTIKYLHNPKRLQSAAVNLAVETFGTTETFLIRMDAHAGYPADFCSALVKEAKASSATSVVVAMNTIGKTFFQKAVAAAQNSKLGNGGAAHRTLKVEGQWVDHGHHALMRIEAFRAVGGYDETFSHNEDAELDVRLRKAGYKIWLTGRTLIDYYPRATPLSLFKQYLKFGQGRARTVLKHRLIPKLRQFILLAVAPVTFLALLTPFLCVAAIPFLIWSLLCLAFGLLLGIRTKSVAIAFSGSAAMIMHFAWSLGFWMEVAKTILKGDFHGK